MRRALLTSLSLAALLVAGPAHAARRPPEARLSGTYILTGVVRAQGVRGERSGQVVHRRWVLTSTCPSGACRTVRLRRPRADGGTDRLLLRRVAPGTYRARGRFWFPLRCARRLVRHGGEAQFTVTVRVTRVTRVQGTAFATGIAASYDNPQRIDHTRCFGDLGHDSARYGGHRLDGAPRPPSASFTATRESVATTTYDFRDTSTAGTRVVARRWDFGDPASGAADRSRQANPSHTFSAPGTHTVTLTVTDADGLTARAAQQVTV